MYANNLQPKNIATPIAPKWGTASNTTCLSTDNWKYHLYGGGHTTLSVPAKGLRIEHELNKIRYSTFRYSVCHPPLGCPAFIRRLLKLSSRRFQSIFYADPYLVPVHFELCQQEHHYISRGKCHVSSSKPSACNTSPVSTCQGPFR